MSVNLRSSAPLGTCVLALLAMAGCGQRVTTQGTHPASVAVDLNLPLAQGIPSAAVLWLHPQDADRSLVVGAAEVAGITLHGLDGRAHAGVSGPVADQLALTYGFDAGAGTVALLVAHDRAAAGLRAYTIEPQSLQLRELTAAVLPVQVEVTGLCLYRSGLSGKHYAFVATDPGELQQWELSAQQGRVQGRIVRRIPMGKGIGACAVEDAGGTVYVSDESVGIWRLSAEPESDTTRELLALTAPRGTLGEEVKGIGLHQGQDGLQLLAVDEQAAAVHVLALPDGRHLGAFSLAGVTEAKFEAIFAAGFAAEPRHAGVVLLADEAGSGAAFRLLRWDAIAAALGMPAAVPADPRRIDAVATRTVEPTIETEPVVDYGDAADDPAIWVHPADPSRSLIIGAQKKRGLEVYDLSGKRVQRLDVGRVNNVDVRQGVLLGGRRRDVAAGSNRDQQTLALFEVEPSGQLRDAAAGPIPTGLRDPYGLCMYHSARSGKLYVFVNNPDAGEFRQWEIEPSGAQLTGRLVREFTVGTQSEGCVADDETGALYIAEEDHGLWRYPAEPDDGSARRQLDGTGDAGRLKADVEGVAIYRGQDGAGYLVVSNQGADNYAVYRREGDNPFVGMFSIVANDALGIDGASETDGLEVTSAPLGVSFPRGLLVVQDGRNISPDARQNFKLVPWERVAAALGL